jgi:cytochrome P450
MGRSSYRLALPLPGGVYVVGDAELQRQILKDTMSDKSPAIHKPLCNITGTKESILNSQSNEYWKLIRKSTAHAFAASQVSRMKEIAFKLTKEWCDYAEESFTKDGSYFDPSYEMVKLKCRVICEAAFEYSITDDEYQMISECLESSLRAFVLRQAINPLRRFFGFMIPEVRLAFESCVKLQTLGKRILDTYRQKTDKSTENTWIYLINKKSPKLGRVLLVGMIVLVIR